MTEYTLEGSQAAYVRSELLRRIQQYQRDLAVEMYNDGKLAPSHADRVEHLVENIEADKRVLVALAAPKLPC